MTNLVEVSIPTPSNTAAERAKVALEAARAREIVTPEDYSAAAAELQAIKGKWKEIDGQRAELVKPIDAARKAVQNFFTPALAWLVDAETVLKNKLVGYQNEQDRLRREEQRKADEAARKERERLAERAAKAAASGKVDKAEELQHAAAAVVAPVVQREAPKVAGLAMRETWLFEVTDAASVPREYLAVDESRVGKVVRALKGDTKIPGVRVWMEKTPASRAS